MSFHIYFVNLEKNFVYVMLISPFFVSIIKYKYGNKLKFLYSKSSFIYLCIMFVI